MTSGYTENIFGKIRGRFDENGAKLVDRTLAEAAMSALTAMPEVEWPRFVRMFNRTFRRGEVPRQIV